MGFFFFEKTERWVLVRGKGELHARVYNGKLTLETQNEQLGKSVKRFICIFKNCSKKKNSLETPKKYILKENKNNFLFCFYVKKIKNQKQYLLIGNHVDGSISLDTSVGSTALLLSKLACNYVYMYMYI